MSNFKYLWSTLDNNKELVHQITPDGNYLTTKVIWDLENVDRLEMLHLSNEKNNYAVDLRSGFFFIGEFTFHPCAEIFDITLARRKEIVTLNEQKYRIMKELNDFKIYENKKDIDELSKKQLRFYEIIKNRISYIEKELTGLKYRLVFFKRNRRETKIFIDNNTNEIISKEEGKQFLYGYAIGWQTTYFGKNYQRFMFLSELYDDIFEIRSKT
ncbi:MAG: hypothetical protein ACTSPK_00185 [Candidatus Heimdallarchaeota archaeon]